MVFDLVNHSVVLQESTVVAEVDLLRCLAQQLHLAAGILVALLEGLKGGNGLATESEVALDCYPVELESCASLIDSLVS